MRRRITVAEIGIVAIVVGAVGALGAYASNRGRGAAEEMDVWLRVNGPARIPPGDTASTVVVIGHDAVVEGTVTEQLVVIGGTAAITGSVLGNVVVANGRAELGPQAYVGGNVVLHESTLERAPGARVAGIVRRRAELDLGPAVGWFLWLSFTAVVLVVGLAFAALAGRQLSEAAAEIAARPGPVVVTALIVAFGLPIFAVLAFVSVIGIPLALLAAIFAIPLLALLGYATTGAWAGAAILAKWRGRDRVERAAAHPYLAVTIGVVLLQIIGVIPVLGGLVVVLASQLGAGALVYRSWRGARREAAT